MGQFQYVKDKHVIINGIFFDLDVFHTLYKDFDMGSAIRIYYDQQKNIHNNGFDQWSGPVPWLQGDIILLRFNDLLMLRRHMMENEV